MTWIPDDLAERFATAWADDILVDDLAGRLTCTEVELLATVLRQCGNQAAGDCWITVHADNERPGDDHYRGPSSS
ncbi:hypothetical protein ABZ896_17230 [Streptomyces sp. NPDC047072]|uniref:hypothetical protein n=1 Tax=Streptomyces sp. NPDC047072 TaxID=3154809 RepID=UPI0033C5399F